MPAPDTARNESAQGTIPPAVFLVDDHPMVRQGLAQFLAASGVPVAGQAEGSADTLAHPELSRCVVAVVDLSLSGESGFDLVRRLCDLNLKVVAYTMHEDAAVIRRALDAGVLGYVTKREAPQHLLESIRAAAAGVALHGPRVREILGDAPPDACLSDQQQRIFELLGEGCSNEEIARELGIGKRTLESYCVRIMDKLGIDGVKELRRRAIGAKRSLSPEDSRPS